MGKFIHIKSAKFPVLSGEEEEIFNEGTYGKALAEYLQIKLTERGYTVPFVCAEDWGWWVELSLTSIRSGVCIYAIPETSDPIEYICTDGFNGDKKWSWSKFRFIDIKPMAAKLFDDLNDIFTKDPEVTVVEITEDFPY